MWEHIMRKTERGSRRAILLHLTKIQAFIPMLVALLNFSIIGTVQLVAWLLLLEV